MMPARTFAVIFGLLVIAPRANASTVEFDLSAVSVAGSAANPLGYTATVSFTLDSSAFADPYQTYLNPDGTQEIAILSSSLTSFSADLTTPVGDQYFNLSQVRTGCGGAMQPCWDMFFDESASGIFSFDFAQDGFAANSSGILNINYGWSAAFHDVDLFIYYSGTWSTWSASGAPLSDVGTGLPSALLLVGGLIIWAWRRRADPERAGSSTSHNRLHT